MTENTSFESRVDIDTIQDAMQRIKQGLGQVLVGQETLVEMLLVSLLADGHILLEGVPGVAKTLTAKLLARSMSVQFSRIQFTPDLMPSDVIGTNVFNPKEVTFEFKQGPIFSNIVLIDEINRAPAKTQAALFEVMEERTITVDGRSYVLNKPFVVIATQNPVEHEGTYQLPEAQLDRFTCKLLVNYPSLQEEVTILERHQQQKSLHSMIETVQPVLNANSLQTLRNLAASVQVSNSLLSYIATIVNRTRSYQGLQLGASPRASVAILQTSKSLATLRGRDFITPEDIIEVAPHVLRHRVSLTAEKEMDGTTTDQVIQDIVRSIEVPR